MLSSTRFIRLEKSSGVENVEGLMFNVGIDPDNNHADPAAWPAGPSRWPRKCRACTGDGLPVTGSSPWKAEPSEGTLEIHALGDDNHFPGEMGVLVHRERMLILGPGHLGTCFPTCWGSFTC